MSMITAGRRLVVAVAVTAVVSTTAVAAEDDSAVVPHTLELRPKTDLRAAHPVKVTFDAAVYLHKGQGKEISRASKSPDEVFVATALDVYRTGTVDQVLKLWLPEERVEKRQLLLSEGGALFKKAQETHRAITHAELRAKVLYGDFVLLGVEYRFATERTTLVYPIVSRGGQYFMTDGLSDDPVFTYLIDRVVRDLGDIEGGRDQP
jgi:hypothetical protein